jgi:hypothetical protein
MVDGTMLDAWPAANHYSPIVKFDIDSTQRAELLGRSEMMPMLLRMGAAGGVLAYELSDEAFVTRFLPALTRYLMIYAENMKMSDEDALTSIGIEPDQWLIGLS